MVVANSFAISPVSVRNCIIVLMILDFVPLLDQLNSSGATSLLKRRMFRKPFFRPRYREHIPKQFGACVCKLGLALPGNGHKYTVRHALILSSF